MSIRREAVDKGLVDFGDVVGRGRIAPVRPGDILRTEFLEPLGLSVYALAKAVNVPRSRINDIVRGRRSISAETALRLARFFGTTPAFWVNLQAQYDLETARRELSRRIDREVKPHAA